MTDFHQYFRELEKNDEPMICREGSELLSIIII